MYCVDEVIQLYITRLKSLLSSTFDVGLFVEGSLVCLTVEGFLVGLAVEGLFVGLIVEGLFVGDEVGFPHSHCTV